MTKGLLKAVRGSVFSVVFHIQVVSLDNVFVEEVTGNQQVGINSIAACKRKLL